jgi:hypothetical protein
VGGFTVELKDRLETADLAALAQLAASQAQVLGYHAPDYQSGMEAVLGDRCRHILVRDDARLSAYLPFRERAGSAGVVLNALPFFGPNGLLLARDDSARDAAILAFHIDGLDEDRRQFLGYYVREPSSMAEFLLPPEQRLYRPGQE